MAYYRAPADRPELPPGYSYTLDGTRIYISHVENGLRRRMRKLRSTQNQYWMKWENAAIAAWKHAYERLLNDYKEAHNHAGQTH